MTFVRAVIIFIVISQFINQHLLEVQIIEWVWTIFPAILLLQIALPRLLLLYMADESADAGFTIKAIGHQWYWRYEYRDFFSLSETIVIFDSYIVSRRDIENEMFRLLDVDNRLVTPIANQIRIIIRSSDVLHSWTVPSLGVKSDAIPGRLNQCKFISYRPGLFFGQCSEICGSNHSFIPIVTESITKADFFHWIISCSDI